VGLARKSEDSESDLPSMSKSISKNPTKRLSDRESGFVKPSQSPSGQIRNSIFRPCGRAHLGDQRLSRRLLCNDGRLRPRHAHHVDGGRAFATVTAASATYPIALRAFDVIGLGANLRAAFTVPRNRSIALTMMLVPAASLISGFRRSFQGRPNLFDLAFFIPGICLSVVLAHRAWREWRARDELRVEFDAAREVQERLVAPAVDLPGFRIESAYAPAKQVGGDFFRVLPESDGSVLVVVDASGKGLRAAMTVSAIIGALRTMPVLAPARILAALNRGLVGQMESGFVTCCAARIGPNGAATIANAGHLSPYLAGAELPVAAGLPLGLLAGTEYEESHFQLHPGQPLTFLSDGVIKARNQNGELFGFERTQAISTEPADKVAQAAQIFGQEDDITTSPSSLSPAQTV
jgi:hypothetical protein